MKLGGLEFEIITDGRFRLDGGAMFGVVPKPMWERAMPADGRNRVQLSMNSLLIRTPGPDGKRILLETGAGDKWDAKRNDIYDFQGARLLEQLAARGILPGQIDIVINTHLHFDHCGWNTRIENGKAVPTFPNARYVVQRGELEHAQNPTERDRASYIPENYQPITDNKQWQLVEGDAEIAPGVELLVVPGHTRDMMCVRLSGGGEAAVFLADLVPTTAHLPLAWMMGFDLYPLTTLENKKKWLPEIASRGLLALFGHDVKVPAARLQESRSGPEMKFTADPVAIDAAPRP